MNGRKLHNTIMMQKTITCLLVVGYFLLMIPLVEASPSPRRECLPSYDEWTTRAQERLRANYPRASAVDFLYVGCKAHSPATTQMMFKYGMSERGREFGVYVNLLVDASRNKVIRSFTEEADGTIASYEKWRTIAIDAIKKRYEDARIKDVRPCRCDPINNVSASQTFKFWIEQNHKWKFSM